MVKPSPVPPPVITLGEEYMEYIILQALSRTKRCVCCVGAALNVVRMKRSVCTFARRAKAHAVLGA